MTRRVAILLAAGAAAVLASGGYALSSRASTDTIKALPHWGLYTSTTWAKLQDAAIARNLVPGSLDIVTGTRLERSGEPFAILRGRTGSGRSCFAVAAGIRVVRIVCRITSPVMLFERQDTCAACAPGAKKPLTTLTVIALVRRDVQSVVSLYDGRGTNVERINASSGASAFNLLGLRAGTTLKALGRTNRPLAEIHLPLAG
jgi:hypothetical protein